MSYRTLEIRQLARDLSFEIHRMTLESLPKLEMYEESSQIRRSVNPSDPILSNDMAGEDTSWSSSAFSPTRTPRAMRRLIILKPCTKQDLSRMTRCMSGYIKS